MMKPISDCDHKELNTCKRIGYEYFCEELFVVKSKHKFRCASAVYFNYTMKSNKIVTLITILIKLI